MSKAQGKEKVGVGLGWVGLGDLGLVVRDQINIFRKLISNWLIGWWNISS